MMITTKEDIQNHIFKEISNVLELFHKEMIDNNNWQCLIYQISSIFDNFLYEKEIKSYSIICNNPLSDYILEYDTFSEGWFLYCHLRKGHLMLKFIPKEF